MKSPKTKKLTPSQYAALAYLSQHPSGDYYDLRRAGSGGGATTSKLVSLGLVAQKEERGMKSWSITENGAEAFASGRYSLANDSVEQPGPTNHPWLNQHMETPNENQTSPAMPGCAPTSGSRSFECKGPTHYAGCCCHEKGWENKWKCAVEMAARAEVERDMWKSNHDNQVEIKRIIAARPDLKERAPMVEKLMAERNRAQGWSTLQHERIKRLEAVIRGLNAAHEILPENARAMTPTKDQANEK